MPQRGIHKRSDIGPSRQAILHSKIVQDTWLYEVSPPRPAPLEGVPQQKFKPAGAINPILAPRASTLYYIPCGISQN